MVSAGVPNARVSVVRHHRLLWVWTTFMVGGIVALAGQVLVSTIWRWGKPWLWVDAAAVYEQMAEQWLQQGWQWAQAGDDAAARVAFDQALAHSGDPGKIAFARGCFEYQRGYYRQAELWFARAAADQASPAVRVGRAWYNIGICQLQRGGEAAVYHSAIVHLRRAVHSGGLEGVWLAQARRHLELAKLLWDEARRREDPRHSSARPPTSDEEPTTDRPPSTTVAGRDDTAPSQASALSNSAPPLAPPLPPSASAQAPPPTAVPVAGAGQLEALRDTATVQKLTPEDTRAYLLQTAERLQRERRELLRSLYGPERPDVRDW
jgi:hypothetical protein